MNKDQYMSGNLYMKGDLYMNGGKYMNKDLYMDKKSRIMWLRKICESKLKCLPIKGKRKTYQRRLEQEFEFVKIKDYEVEFLTLNNVVNYAKQNNIPVGPGKSSVTGSLIAYCLEITDIDPIKNKLFCEPFYKPLEKVSPRVDLDISSDNYEKIKNFIEDNFNEMYEKYIGRILPLAELDMLKSQIQDVEKNEGFNIDLSDIDMNDPYIYEWIDNIPPYKIFQLDKPYMQVILIKLKPKNFNELIATFAMCQELGDEIKNKYSYNRENPYKIEYLHDKLIPILSETYGLILYKEQILEIFHRLAGFSLVQSEKAMRDILRQMNNKEIKKMFINGNNNKNIPGCINNGIDVQTASDIFEKIVSNRKNVYQKSHSVAYMTLAYRMAYVRFYYYF